MEAANASIAIPRRCTVPPGCRPPAAHRRRPAELHHAVDVASGTAPRRTLAADAWRIRARGRPAAAAIMPLKAEVALEGPSRLGLRPRRISIRSTPAPKTMRFVVSHSLITQPPLRTQTFGFVVCHRVLITAADLCTAQRGYPGPECPRNPLASAATRQWTSGGSSGRPRSSRWSASRGRRAVDQRRR